MSGESIEFGIILLAAGGSVRMGRAKQLLPWRGRPLLLHAAESAVIVVLGAGAVDVDTPGDYRSLTDGSQ